jgi:hypothetical protein
MSGTESHCVFTAGGERVNDLAQVGQVVGKCVDILLHLHVIMFFSCSHVRYYLIFVLMDCTVSFNFCSRGFKSSQINIRLCQRLENSLVMYSPYSCNFGGN